MCETPTPLRAHRARARNRKPPTYPQRIECANDLVRVDELERAARGAVLAQRVQRVEDDAHPRCARPTTTPRGSSALGVRRRRDAGTPSERVPVPRHSHRVLDVAECQLDVGDHDLRAAVDNW